MTFSAFLCKCQELYIPLCESISLETFLRPLEKITLCFHSIFLQPCPVHHFGRYRFFFLLFNSGFLFLCKSWHSIIYYIDPAREKKSPNLIKNKMENRKKNNAIHHDRRRLLLSNMHPILGAKSAHRRYKRLTSTVRPKLLLNV